MMRGFVVFLALVALHWLGVRVWERFTPAGRAYARFRAAVRDYGPHSPQARAAMRRYVRTR